MPAPNNSKSECSISNGNAKEKSSLKETGNAMEESKGTRGLEGDQEEEGNCLRMKSWVASIGLGLASCRGKTCKVPDARHKVRHDGGEASSCRIA
jgi:hypothetical protein